MTVSLKHTFQSAKTDSTDTSLIQPSNWNDEHQLTLATNKVLGRATAGTGAAEELSVGTALSLSGGTLAVTNVPVANGGTGATTLAANNVLLGNGTAALQTVAPGAAGNILSSNGTTWVSSTPASTGNYTEYLNRSTDVTLLSTNVGKVVVDPTVSIMVQLPVATTLTQGQSFEITNISEQNNLFVKSSDGTYQAFVAAGQTVNVTAENVATAAGVWVADNPNYGFSSPVSFGYVGTYTNNAINSATAAISATKMIRVNYTGTSQIGVTATIITKSGSTITKGSPQFLFNFNLVTSTRGFINIIMTSATTGIISTFGNNTSGTSNVLLYTFSIDVNDVVQITGQNSFAASASTQTTSISMSMLSATSLIVTYHVSSVTYAARILTLSSGLITAIGNQSNIYTSDFGQYPQVVALSATLVVTGYIDNLTTEFYLRAGSISGTTITWGTAVLQSTTGSALAAYGISRLSGTEFIVSAGAGSTVLSNYGSVSGTTITLGAQDTYTGGGAAIYSTMTYPVSSASALVVFYDSSGANNKPYAFVLTKSGTALSRGTVYVLATSPTPTATEPSPFSLKGFVAFDPIQQPATDFYMDYAAARYVFAVPISVSGTVVTPGTGTLVTPESVSTAVSACAICTLSKTRAIAFVNYNVASDGTASSRLYLLDTSNARPVVLATSTTISTATVFCAGQLTATRAIIAYSTSSNAVSTIRTLDITGDVFTFNASITGTSFIGTRPAVRKISPTKAMLYVANTSSDHRIYNIAISGTTLTESPSYVTTGDNAAQTSTSRRILYNYGDVGYFFAVQGSTGYIYMFNVSGVSPTNGILSVGSIGTTNLPTYNANLSAGVMTALAAQTSSTFTAAVYAGVDGSPRVYSSPIGPEYNGTGITMPFSATSVIICGNGVNYYGKLTINPAYAGTPTNNTIPNQVRAFTPTLSMHEPIQDWVDGDYFAPNTRKILFFGYNTMNLEMEMYHVFDRGAAQ